MSCLTTCHEILTEDTHIRALVDAVACPKAISDLKLISESIRKYGDHNKMQVAMDDYTNAEASVFRSRRMKIFAAINICAQFEKQCDICQTNLTKEKVKRRRKLRRDRENTTSGKTLLQAKLQPHSQRIIVAEWFGNSHR
jgi:hypothetical protein